MSDVRERVRVTCRNCGVVYMQLPLQVRGGFCDRKCYHEWVRSGRQGDQLGQFKIDGVYCRLIPLTKGQYVIVDAADYDWLSQRNWCAWLCPGMRSCYAVCSIRRNGGNERILMHRLILGLGKGDKRQADHKEPSHTLDNRRSNLRISTCSQNAFNSRLRRTSSSGFKGVSYVKSSGRWRASITVNGTFKHLGCFSSPELAHDAYCKATTEICGEFARVA